MDARIRWVVIGVFLILSSTVYANDLYVGSGETYATIQSAIAASVNGDTVIADPCTYNENIDFGII